jgi:3-phosphoshikimate 1-carboxyvinyltransferase
MEISIEPVVCRVAGRIAAPPSKSMMQRVCAAALLHRGTTIIHNPGTSNDDKAALDIIRQLGAEINDIDGKSLQVTSNGIYPKHQMIDCGESGLSARLFTPIAALAGEIITVTGHGSLLQRPMQETEKILQQLGVTIHDFTGYLPITFTGPAKPADIFLDGSLSSQYVTGVLFALSFAAQHPVTVFVNNLKSKPYVDLSLQVLADFGKHIEHDNYKAFHITPSEDAPGTVVQTIEADWSSAAAMIVAGAIAGEVTLPDLNAHTSQADVRILDALKSCGANVQWIDDELHVQTSDVLNAFSFDAADCPDLFPVLSILAASCNGTTELKGLHRLVHKESNRAASIAYMLQHLGVSFYEEGDSLFITGKKKFAGATIPSFNDHRMAMAAAIAALRAESTIVITEAEAVSKSYPLFFEHLDLLLHP